MTARLRLVRDGGQMARQARPDYGLVSEGLRKLLDVIKAGEMDATPAMRYRIEGAIVAFRAVADGRVPDLSDLSSLQETTD